MTELDRPPRIDSGNGGFPRGDLSNKGCCAECIWLIPNGLRALSKQASSSLKSGDGTARMCHLSSTSKNGLEGYVSGDFYWVDSR